MMGNQPVYISFDIDGLDPCYAPGTGTIIGHFEAFLYLTISFYHFTLNFYTFSTSFVLPMFLPHWWHKCLSQIMLKMSKIV